MNKLFFLVILVFFLCSCVVKKETNSNFSLPPKNSAELIKRVNSKNIYTDWLYLKGKINIIKKEQDITFSISIKHKRDSIIWISASGPFGIEIIRAQITPDSICLINRINKQFLLKPINYISFISNLDFSFYDFQDMVTANPMILKDNYKLVLDGNNFNLASSNFNYYINDKYMIEKAKIINNKFALEFAYGNHYQLDNFPRKFFLKFDSDELLEININYSKVEFNKPQNILFKIPESYNEIK